MAMLTFGQVVCMRELADDILWDHRASHDLHCANAFPVAEALFDSKNVFLVNAEVGRFRTSGLFSTEARPHVRIDSRASLSGTGLNRWPRGFQNHRLLFNTL